MFDQPVQMQPGVFWPTMLGLFALASMWMLDFGRRRGAAAISAETIQQHAQKLINASFETLQLRYDGLTTKYTDLFESHVRLESRTEVLALQNGLQQSRIEELGDTQKLQKAHYEGIIEALRSELRVEKDAREKTEFTLGEACKSMQESQEAQDEMLKTIDELKKQIAAQDSRIAELETELARQVKKMDKVTDLLVQSEKARKAAEAERDQARAQYEKLLADIDRKVAASVDEKTSSLRDDVARLETIAAEKDAKIAELEAKLAENAAKSDENRQKPV